MPHPLPARRELARISHTETDGRYCLLHLECPEAAGVSLPGQFVHLRAVGDAAPQQSLLRRPFSIHLWLDENGEPAPDAAHATGLAIYFKILGPGTQSLARLAAGDAVDFLGPMGMGRPEGDPVPDVTWCVGGGYGVAPMLFWGQATLSQPGERRLVFGVNHPRDLPRFPSWPDGYFETLSRCLSMQFHISVLQHIQDYFCGTCIDLLLALIRESREAGSSLRHEVVACGPMGMMKAAALAARNEDISCRVMLEEMMACGTGVCRSCVCAGVTEDGAGRNITVCREGPLLDSDQVAWNRIR